MKRAAATLKGLIPDLPDVPAEAVEACRCDGSGYLPMVDDRNHRYVLDCVCRVEKRLQAKLAKAEIPERYRTTTLDGFDAIGGHPTLGRGLAAARRWVAEYPVGTQGRGMLLVGPVGVGKTHLAVGMLREVVVGKGARGLFCDFRDLLNRIKRTFSEKAGPSEAEILGPVFAADVLVLDELGAARSTDWTFDAAENILNARYNDNRSTIITTNLPNRPPGAGGPGSSPAGSEASEYGRAAAAAMRAETLGDRIGARMHSRLQQMCHVVEMTGEDYRAGKGRR